MFWAAIHMYFSRGQCTPWQPDSHSGPGAINGRWVKANSSPAPNPTGMSPDPCWDKSSRLRLHWAQIAKGSQWAKHNCPLVHPISTNLFKKTQGISSYAFIHLMLISGEVIRLTLLPMLAHNPSFPFGHLTSYHLLFLTKILFLPLSKVH